MLFIKPRQKSWQNHFYWDLMLKLDRSSTQAVSVKNYQIRSSRSNYRHIPMYLYRLSFLTTLDIYKDYFKGHHACIVWLDAKSGLVHYSLCRKLLRLYAKGFVTKELPDLHCWWFEELCSQQSPSSWCVSHVLGSMHYWLITYWDSCIEWRDYRYNTSPNGYWGKGSIVGWYFGIDQRVW